MVVCPFFMSGSCKYGDRCYNEHPRGNGPAGGAGVRGVTFRDSFGTAGGTPQGQNPYKWTAPGSGGGGVGGGGPQQQQQQQQASNIPAQDIVKSLPKEMEVWQTSKMWPFSCFSLEKELPSLPEFVDMSPEELRLDAYTAIQQGTVDAFKQKVSLLAQEFRQKQDQIRAMPDALRQNLTQILEEGRRQRAARASGGQSVVRPSTFGGGTQTGSSVFGAGAGNSIFGGGGNNSSSSSPAVSSSFGFGSTAPNTSMSGSLFGMGGASGSQQTTSLFGQQQPSSSTASVFGSSQTSTASGTASIFGQPAPGLFGSGAVSTPASSAGGGGLFGGGGGGGLFAQSGGGGGGAVPAPGLFGKGAASGVGGGFGQSSTPGNVFGQNVGSVFGQSSGGGGLFGKPPASSAPASVFGQSTAASTVVPAPGLFGAAPSSQSSVFGGSSATGGATATASIAPQPGLFGAAGGSVFGGGGSTFGGGAAAAASAVPNDSGSLYTPLADLTESEKAQFEAKTFTAGMIPMRPPPRELINI
ncbi:uncharacterized protein LOC143276900 [Babylonia areolata]|uniref:uncharacterized protein LOC143276900 n=1 Tax=Babylonia areolata TaxID=304850 RepID=UPI003FD5E8CD